MFERWPIEPPSEGLPEVASSNYSHSRGENFFQRNFMAEVNAKESETFNLLKLKCKFNNGLFNFLSSLGFRNEQFVHHFANNETIGNEKWLMINPIMMHLA